MIEDAELLRQFAEEHSDAAFAALVERHIGFVYAAALRQLAGAQHRAEDVTQTVFIDLARKAAALARRGELLGWLHTSTHYAAAKLKRGEQRRQKYELESHAMNASDVGGTVDWEQLRPVLDDALQSLDERDREAILMRYFQGRRFADIGRRLQLSDDAARMRVDRALEKLRALLARRHITSTSAALVAVLANQPAVAVPAGLTATVTATALATSTAGIGGIVTLLFMNAKTIIASAVALVALGIAGYTTFDLQAQRAAVASLQQQRGALQRQVDELQQRVTAVTNTNIDLQRQVRSPQPTRVTVQSPQPGGLTITGTVSNTGNAVVLPGGGVITLRQKPSDPVAARRQERENRAHNLDVGYAPLYEQLNLAPADREKFKAAMLDAAEPQTEVFKQALADARAKNPNLTGAEAYEIGLVTADQIRKEQVAAARQALGDQAADALQHYHETLPARAVVNELTNALSSSDHPLPPAQTDPLINMLAQHAVGPIGKVDMQALDLNAAIADIEAHGMLDAAQIARLREIAAQMQERAKAQRAITVSPLARPRG